MLANKKIILISVKFFNYEVLIKQELEKMGASVTLFDERPSNSFLSKAIIRVKKEFYKNEINRYYNELIKKLKGQKIDYLLLIKGEAIPKFFLEFLRSENPTMRMIYYTYDSFKNNKNGLEIMEMFDYSFTFDSNDAAKYNMRFRPLFFVEDYSALYLKNDKEYKYDLAFIGTAHSDRYSIAETARSWCSKNSFKMFCFYFSPSKLLFNIKKLTEKSFRSFDKSKISFSSLSHSEIISIYRDSKAILDINHPGQNGLTMRTFEALGAGRKLITTNANIKNYPFYNSDNICIINREAPIFEKEFFEKEFTPIDEEIYHSMSIQGWIEEIFGIKSFSHWSKHFNLLK